MLSRVWGHALNSPNSQDLLRLSIEWNWHLPVVLTVSGWLLLLLVLAGLGLLVFVKWSHLRGMFHTWKPIELEINLGHVGKVKLCPQEQERQIAYRIWTELVTRKAAIPIDLNNDVIVEIYDSWYSLFQCVRSLIGEICAADLPTSESKRKLVGVATQTLNEGLRPHLTLWQARLRHWLRVTKDEHESLSPQEHQRAFPEFERLSADLLRVNADIIQYAAQLKMMIDSR
jgi:hypothetical protein